MAEHVLDNISAVYTVHTRQGGNALKGFFLPQANFLSDSLLYAKNWPFIC